VLKEMAAAHERDHGKASVAFDAALFGHLRFTAANFARSLVLGLTGSRFVALPRGVAPETRRYYRQLTRFSAAFAFLADVSMGVLGGALKRKEKLSARLGDVLSLLYLSSAALRRYEVEGRHHADLPLVHWSVQDAMYKAQAAIEGVIANFPNRAIAMLATRIIFPLGRPCVPPSDALGHKVASLLIEPSATRDRLTAPIYIGEDGNDAVTLIERALAATLASEPIEAKIRAAARDGRIDGKLAPGEGLDLLVARARGANVIDAAEAEAVMLARDLVAKVIRVDDFPQDFGVGQTRPGEAEVPKVAPKILRKAAA
jgi:acyl-CoA dehydrogenase